LGNLNFHDDVESVEILWTPPDEPDYVWSLNEGAQGSITENGPTVTYTAGCGSYIDTLSMKYKNKDYWQTQANITVINLAPSIDVLSLSNDIVFAGELVTLTGQWSDPCADYAYVTVNWDDGTDEDVDPDNEGNFIFTHAYVYSGSYEIEVCVSDGDDEICQDINVIVEYDCSVAEPSISKIWPPNHKMVGIEIMGVTDGNGDPLHITIIDITQDETLNAKGNGNITPGGDGIGTDTAQVRAERSGSGNGRVYEISFNASDVQGGECEGSITVCVPHDQRPDLECVDDGQTHHSTIP
jgi:hypothetical protein